MGKIRLENIEIFAFHGHLPEENKIGSRFIVNLEMETAFEKACETDNLEDTFDYEMAFNIVKEEMQTTSMLLEHLAGRILKRLLNASPLVRTAKISISKMNPPFNGNVGAASVELFQERNQ